MERRWVSMKLVAVGPGGGRVPLGGRVLDVRHSMGGYTAATILVSILILAGAMFVPHLLLISIPVLVARTAVRFWWLDRRERVATDAFACPECGGENPPAEHRGTLPLDVRCARCRATLSVGQVPRTYPPT